MGSELDIEGTQDIEHIFGFYWHKRLESIKVFNPPFSLQGPQ